MNKMLITKDILTEKLTNYLNSDIFLNNLVDWTERVFCEEGFEEKDFELIRDILAQLGLADVKEFGLLWEDCREYLHHLGHTAKVSIY